MDRWIEFEIIYTCLLLALYTRLFLTLSRSLCKCTVHTQCMRHTEWLVCSYRTSCLQLPSCITPFLRVVLHLFLPSLLSPYFPFSSCPQIIVHVVLEGKHVGFAGVSCSHTQLHNILFFKQFLRAQRFVSNPVCFCLYIQNTSDFHTREACSISVKDIVDDFHTHSYQVRCTDVLALIACHLPRKSRMLKFEIASILCLLAEQRTSFALGLARNKKTHEHCQRAQARWY